MWNACMREGGRERGKEDKSEGGMEGGKEGGREEWSEDTAKMGISSFWCLQIFVIWDRLQTSNEFLLIRWIMTFSYNPLVKFMFYKMRIGNDKAPAVTQPLKNINYKVYNEIMWSLFRMYVLLLDKTRAVL